MDQDKMLKRYPRSYDFDSPDLFPKWNEDNSVEFDGSAKSVLTTLLIIGVVGGILVFLVKLYCCPCSPCQYKFWRKPPRSTAYYKPPSDNRTWSPVPLVTDHQVTMTEIIPSAPSAVVDTSFDEPPPRYSQVVNAYDLKPFCLPSTDISAGEHHSELATLHNYKTHN